MVRRWNPRTAVVLALCLLGLWHLALRRHGLPLPRISDEGEYAYEARLMAEDGVPYRDAYDQKPPLVFFLYRLSNAVFGERAEGPRLLAALFCWATMAFLFASVPAEWGPGPRLVAPAVFGTLSTLPIGDMGFAANTEAFLTAFAAASAWALGRFWTAGGRRWLFVSGVAAGAAVSTKQTAAWTGLAFGLLIAVPFGAGAASGPAGSGGPRRAADDLRIRCADAAAYLGGCLVVPLALLSFFLLRGGAADMIDQVLRRNMDYASLVLRSGGLGGKLAWLMKAAVPLFLAGGWPAAGLAAYGLASVRVRSAEPTELLATLWLGAALVGASTGLFFFPHYFLPALAPLALAASLGARRWTRRGTASPGSPASSGARGAGTKGYWLVAALSVYPAVAYARVYFLDPPETVARELMYPNPLFESVAVADYLRARSAARDLVYVFGSEPQIYVEAGRRAATRHIFVYPLTLFPRREEEIAEELAHLSAARPKFIVFVNQPASTLISGRLGHLFRAGIVALLAREYRWVGTVELRSTGSLTAFWGEEAGPGASPDWDAKDRIYLFERR